METEQELNKKLAEWAGVKPEISYTIEPQVDEMGGTVSMWNKSKQVITYPNFTQSLDACFKWLVPRLYPLGKQVLLVNLSETRNHAKIVDAFAREETVDGLAQTPALALCRAIEKLIDSEAK